jgi:expansin (peptidoglycan-binding protein)
MDYNSDGRVDSFDLITARKNKEISRAELNALQKFVLGVNGKIPTEFEIPDLPIDEDAILEPKGTVHTGEGTFYGGGYTGGHAMLDPVSHDYWIVAMNHSDYNEAQLAGAYLEVTGELGTIKMLVTDELPEGKKGDLDLYTDAFPLIAPVEKGRVPVSWKIIPLDTAATAPISFKYKEGSTEFWCGVQVRNHRYPITKLELLKDGEWVEIPRRPYNYFESREMGAGPFTFRITDIYGQVIIDKDIPLSYDDTEIIPGHVQFPL